MVVLLSFGLGGLFCAVADIWYKSWMFPQYRSEASGLSPEQQLKVDPDSISHHDELPPPLDPRSKPSAAEAADEWLLASLAVEAGLGEWGRPIAVGHLAAKAIERGLAVRKINGRWVKAEDVKKQKAEAREWGLRVGQDPESDVAQFVKELAQRRFPEDELYVLGAAVAGFAEGRGGVKPLVGAVERAKNDPLVNEMLKKLAQNFRTGGSIFD